MKGVRVTGLFDLMIRISQLVRPVFIFCTVANIGMTQDFDQV